MRSFWHSSSTLHNPSISAISIGLYWVWSQLSRSELLASRHQSDHAAVELGVIVFEGGQVPVTIEGYPDRRMPEHRLQALRREALLDPQRAKKWRSAWKLNRGSPAASTSPTFFCSGCHTRLTMLLSGSTLPMLLGKTRSSSPFRAAELPFPQRVNDDVHHRDLAVPGRRLGRADGVPLVRSLARDLKEAKTLLDEFCV